VKEYLLSVPERLVRALLGLGAGAAREVGEVALPDGVRHSELYKNLVDTTLRFLIEDVGGVEGLGRAAGELPPDFMVRRAAGNVVEVLGIVAFRASPVWVLAALADLCGTGRQLIPEIAEALKAEGLLREDMPFTTVDELLDGLQRTSSRLAAAINTPPLDVAGLRAEWDAIRTEARSLQPHGFPAGDIINGLWADLKAESRRQHQSIFETSSMMALTAARSAPDGLRWLSASARTGAGRTGQILGGALIDHYRQTLNDIRQVGYVTYAGRQLQPYARAAVRQFEPSRSTFTQRAIDKLKR
jgi:hypothetical protein